MINTNKALKKGITTGTCAAAAAKAAAIAACTGSAPKSVNIVTPSKVDIKIDICYTEIGDKFARCGVKKYSGDDPDVTDGVVVYAKVTLTDGCVTIDGGFTLY